MTTDKDDFLERTFAEARRHPAEPDAALMARVLADAESVQAGLIRAPGRRRTSLWQRLRVELGGWPALAGLGAAALAGVWIGVSPPDALQMAAEGVIGVTGGDYVIDLGRDDWPGLEEGAL